MSQHGSTNTGTIVARNGIIAGLIMGGMFLITYPFREQIGFGALGMALGYTSMVLAFLMIHVGTRTYRDAVAGGTVSYGHALKVALLIALVATVIYIVIWELVYFLLLPDFMVEYGKYAVEQARVAGKSPAELDAMSKQMAEFAEAYRNPLVVAAYTFLEPLPVAVPFSLVSAWLVSRRSGSVAAAHLTA
jgi:hypothetical protein